MRVVSIDSPDDKPGKIVGTRLASIVLPEPGGPSIKMLGSIRCHAFKWAMRRFCRYYGGIAKAKREVQSAMPDNAPRRRWLRFGLRTMFVVLTVFSVWLGWQAKIVRDRREALAKLESDGSKVMTTDDVEPLLGINDMYSWNDAPWPTIPRWRKWIGDKPIVHIVVQKPKDGDLEQLHQLFPEAWWVQGPEGF